jgi:hypothetical protein
VTHRLIKFNKGPPEFNSAYSRPFGIPSVFCGIRVVLLISVLCYVVMFVLINLRPVSGVHNVATVSGLHIRDCPFDFL